MWSTTRNYWYLKGEKECRKNNLSSSRSECRSEPNPLQEWVDVFEFQITWLANSRRPSLKTIFLFFVLFHFPQFKRHSGATNDGFVPIRLGNMRNPSTRWGTKKSIFFLSHSTWLQHSRTKSFDQTDSECWKEFKVTVFPYHFIKWLKNGQHNFKEWSFLTLWR